eukprot:212108-Prorocentrum_lima.AAC.1
MSLKSVLIKIGNEEGVQWNMYNRKFRWSGTNDIVDFMAGTHMLDGNRTTGRLLQSYGALSILPEGVEHPQNWV